MNYLALDFGGSTLKYALVSDKAEIMESGKLPAPLESKEAFVDMVGVLYERFSNKIEGIAISLPGYIDSETGTLHGSGAYQKLYGLCIPELLREKCPIPISVENDGKCGALSEVWKGALKDCRDGAVIILGSGIGGGIIKDGKVHSGKGFTAGELSYLIIDPDKYGYDSLALMHACLAGMAFKLCKLKNLDMHIQDLSELVLLLDRLYGSRYAHVEGEPLKIKATGKQLLKWFEEEDEAAVKVYWQFIHSLAIIIFNVQIIYAPEKIVIGGGLSCEERVFTDLQKELQKHYEGTMLPQQLKTNLVRSQYLDQCNLLGAVYHYRCRFS